MDPLPQNYVIGGHFLNATGADQDGFITSDNFFSGDQQLLITATNADIPNVVGRNQFHNVNIDHQYFLNQGTLDLKEIAGSNNGVLPTVPSEFVSQDQLAQVSIELPDSENAEDVEEEQFTLDENGPVVMIQDALCENDDEIPMSYTGDHNGYGDQVLDEGLREAIQMINENDGIQAVNFVAIESEKSKNPPYMIGEKSKIVTKDNEPIKFCLQGAKVDQTVIATLRYTEEKFKNNPVRACKLHCKGNSPFAFILSAAGKEVEQRQDSILEHPTVHFQLQADNLVFNGSFTFYITMLCLNSCHKSDGKRVELVLKVLDGVLDGNGEQLIKEDRFIMRVCRNVKRDFREAFPEGTYPPQKISKPESFIRKKETQDLPIVSQEEAQPSRRKVNVVRMSPADEKASEEKVVIHKKRAQPTPPQGNKFYLGSDQGENNSFCELSVSSSQFDEENHLSPFQEHKMPHQEKIKTDKVIQLLEEKLTNVRSADEFDTVGKNVANKLRSLPQERRIVAEKLINDVLYEAQIGNLNCRSQLFIG